MFGRGVLPTRATSLTSLKNSIRSIAAGAAQRADLDLISRVLRAMALPRHSVDAHRRKQQRHGGEDRRQQHLETGLGICVRHNMVHRQYLRYRQVSVNGPDRLFYGIGESSRCPRMRASRKSMKSMCDEEPPPRKSLF